MRKIATKPAKDLLMDDDVRRWFENMKRSSELNALVRLRRLNLFCYRLKTTPRRLARMGADDPKKVEDVLMDHVSWMEGQGFASGYVDGMIKAIKGWLVHNRVEVKTKIKVSNVGVSPTLEDEKVPEQVELRQILEKADLRQRAAVSLMAFSGIRPQVMGKSDRSDGLRLGDLPELVIGEKDGEVRFTRTPAMVVVRQALSKTNNKYVTFLSGEGCRHLLAYLKQRMSAGERLRPESPVLTVIAGRAHKFGITGPGGVAVHLVTPSISGIVKKAVAAVMKGRPYALRAYFDTQLLAESHGCMADAYRAFFMGHKGDIEARYTTNKGRLTEQMREDMRRAYTQSEMFLSTDPGRTDQRHKKDMLRRMWRKQAEMYGVDPDSMMGPAGGVDGKAAPKKPGTDQARDTGTGDGGGGTGPAPAGGDSSGGGRPEFRIAAGDDELVRYSSEGWDIARELGDGRFLMRRGRGEGGPA